MRKLVARMPMADLPPGEMRRLDYPPFDVLIVNLAGLVFAIEDSCNHAGASLSEGYLEGSTIACGAHGYVFDLRTGELLVPKGLCGDQRSFAVEREGDMLAVYDTVEAPIGPTMTSGS